MTRDHNLINGDADATLEARAIAEVVRLEAKRHSAMMENNADALSELMHTSLKYKHSTGLVDNKDSYLKNLREGVVRYISLEPSNTMIRLLHADLALASGQITGTVSVAGAEKSIAGNYTIKWQKLDGQWSMVEAENIPLSS
jgi:hypothetical protein